MMVVANLIHYERGFDEDMTESDIINISIPRSSKAW